MNVELQKIAELLLQADTVSLVPHTSPDADALGSCFAVAQVLGGLGKEAVVYTDEPAPAYLSFLQGKSQVFEGAARQFDVCLCLDCGDLQRLSTRSALLGCARYSINVDHHYTNTYYADFNYVDADASSTGEICCQLIALMEAPMSAQTATCLYTAITADTGGFRYSNTTPQTMRVAAELLESGVDIWKVNRSIFDTVSIGKLHLNGRLAQNVQVYENGLIASVEATQDMIQESGASDEEVNNIVDIARQVAGSEAAVSFKETKQGIKVSMRSNEYLDVGEVAVAFGGGGHKRAAGMTMQGSLPEVKDCVIGALAAKIKQYQEGQNS